MVLNVNNKIYVMFKMYHQYCIQILM